MNTIDDFIETEFEKLFPYKPLTAPEKAAIKTAFIRFMESKRKMRPTHDSIDHDKERYRIKFINRLLEEMKQ